MTTISKKIVFSKGTDPFLRIGLGEGYIFAPIPDSINADGTYRLCCWGVDLTISESDEKNVSEAVHDEMYVCGKSSITFYGVKKICINVSPYQDQQANGFAKDEHGEKLRLKHALQAADDLSDCIKHEVEAVLDWPYGYCVLHVWASGEVEYEYVPETLITMKQFFKEPKKFSYQRKSNGGCWHFPG